MTQRRVRILKERSIDWERRMTQRRVRILKRKRYRVGKRDDTEKG